MSIARAVCVFMACIVATAAIPIAALPVLAADSVEFTTSQLIWNPEDRTETKTGALTWEGGIEISSSDPEFGGWSGLAISPDGSALLAVSDEGRWLTAILLYDERGRLSGLAEAKISPMLGLDGQPISGKALGDAESLVIDSGKSETLLGNAYVGFERAHRIWRYDLEKSGAGAKPEQLLTQRHFGRLNLNAGIESLELLPPSNGSGEPRLMAITEETLDPRGNIKAFIADGHDISWFAIEPREPYKPTDMARLPNGAILLLERRFPMLAGVGLQLRRIAADDIKPDAIVDGEVLVDVGQRYSIDNMEGIAVREGENGDLLVYMISDNNFNALQRTLLLMFRLPGEGTKPALPGRSSTLPQIPEAGAPFGEADKSEEAVQEPS